MSPHNLYEVCLTPVFVSSFAFQTMFKIAILENLNVQGKIETNKQQKKTAQAMGGGGRMAKSCHNCSFVWLFCRISLGILNLQVPNLCQQLFFPNNVGTCPRKSGNPNETLKKKKKHILKNKVNKHPNLYPQLCFPDKLAKLEDFLNFKHIFKKIHTSNRDRTCLPMDLQFCVCVRFQGPLLSQSRSLTSHASSGW